MIGRTRTALAALAVAALAACGDSPANDTAAEVGGSIVTRDDYEEVLQAVIANPEVFGVEEDVDTGTVSGDAGRSVLQAMILDVAGQEFLAAEGDSITDADRDAAIETLGTQIDAWPPAVAELFISRQAGLIAFTRLAESTGEPQALYEASPAELGLLCVRHILVATEEEAQDVLQQLADGADFAELAAEVSTDPGSAQSGGALEAQPGQPCIPISDAEAGLDATFFEAAAGAVPGEPVGPVQTSFGWHVILARPYEEVSTAAKTVVGQQLFEDHVATIDVQVDPRYGRWDSAERSVVAL